ncbi:hypothetical protein Y032_0089g2275 [Ancylostoma ceylanicum]|uniref:Uncharacterized protein n=1 Tax=Ancylostoma ceylanicum TaxID=53326 RepID=A0A016TN66_9BILA|nr:hypothetical protein Y032_0089g2275 [Ancylostoma ceylanicum]
MFPSKLLNSLKTLNQLPSIAWGPHKRIEAKRLTENLIYSISSISLFNLSLQRSPQEIRSTVSKSASKTASGGTHPITNGHGHQVSFPSHVRIVLLKKIDGLRVLFLNVATAPSRPRRDGANAQSVYLIEKDCN